MADGWITIGTKLDTDKFDRQIHDLEKKMQKEEDKKIVIETKLDAQEQELDNTRKKVDQLADAYQKLKNVQDRVAQGKATPTEFASMQNLQNTYGSLDKINMQFEKALGTQTALEQKVEQTKLQYEQINKTVGDYKQKIGSIKLQKQTNEIQQMKNGFDKVGNSISDAVKKAAKLALGIFAVRSAYMMLRRASSDLASYDEEYATNLEYIRFVLTQAIAPVLRGIVQLAYTLLQYINMIVNALFGVNLFTNGSAEAFNKMKQSAGGVSKAVTEIKKQLLGFDEINVLTEQSDTGTSVGGSSFTPAMDLSEIQGEPPQWLQWIKDNKEEILSFIGGLAGGLLAFKLGFGGLQALGIGVTLAGILETIQGIVRYIKDPSWKNFGKTIKGLGLIIAGLGILLQNPLLALIGVVTTVVGVIIENWDKIKQIFENAINWLKDKGDWVQEHFGLVGRIIYDTFISKLELIFKFFDTLFTSIKGIFNGFIEFFKGVFTGNWKQAVEGIGQIFENVFNFIKYKLSAAKEWIFKTVIEPIGKFFKGLWDMILQGFKTAWEGIKFVFSKVGEFFENTFGNAWRKVKEIFSKGGKVFDGIKEGIVTTFKNIVNALITGINKVVSIPFNAINVILDTLRNFEIFGGKPFNWVGSISVPQIPYLKHGAILNVPNKGTLVGGGRAIAGERRT